jgi:DNA repair ATPase RecN
VGAETAEFEQCTAQIQALRVVHARSLKTAMTTLSGEALRGQVDTMIGEIRESFLKLGGRRSYAQLFHSLRAVLGQAQNQAAELRDLLTAACNRLNGEFGFSLMVPAEPDLEHFREDLALIERNYVQYLGLTQAVRLAQPRFLEQFRRMLMSRLRAVFEGASGEIELWSRNVSGQIDAQLRERRKAFKRRRESLERIRMAASELDTRLAELQAQDQRLATTEVRLQSLHDRVRRAASRHELALPSDFSPLAPRPATAESPASASQVPAPDHV